MSLKKCMADPAREQARQPFSTPPHVIWVGKTRWSRSFPLPACDYGGVHVHGDHALVRAAPGQFLRQLPAHFSHAGQGIAVLGKGAPCGQAFGQRRGIHFKQQGRLGRRRLPGLDRLFMLASYSPRRCKKSPSAPRLVLFPPAFHAHPHAPLSSHTKITGGLGRLTI